MDGGRVNIYRPGAKYHIPGEIMRSDIIAPGSPINQAVNIFLDNDCRDTSKISGIGEISSPAIKPSIIRQPVRINQYTAIKPRAIQRHITTQTAQSPIIAMKVRPSEIFATLISTA